MKKKKQKAHRSRKKMRGTDVIIVDWRSAPYTWLGVNDALFQQQKTSF
jgi:hypothetical protein